MKAIIPVAGVGERLKPFTFTTPKPLLPVAGKPIISHIIDTLIAYGIDELILILGYMGEKIEEFVRNSYPNRAKFVYQRELLGLAYAVKLGIDELNDEPFIILLGDTVVKLPPKSIFDWSENYVGLVEVENPERFGVAVLEGEYIVEVEEKPKYPRSNHILAGIYIFNKPMGLIKAINELIEKGIKTHGEFQLTDALSIMLERGEKIRWFKLEEWYDCGTPESLVKTNRKLLEGITTNFSGENSIIIPPCYIAESAMLKYSIVGPYVSIGNHSVIEESIVKDSIIGERSSLKRTILDSSVVGNGVVFVGKGFRLNIGDLSQVFLEWRKEKE